MHIITILSLSPLVLGKDRVKDRKKLKKKN